MGPRPRPGQLREANNLLEILWQHTLRKQESLQSSEDGPADRDARRGPSARGGSRMWWRHQTAWTSGEGAASCTLVLYLGTTNASHKPVEQSWSWASRTHQCGAGLSHWYGPSPFGAGGCPINAPAGKKQENVTWQRGGRWRH